ncbi:MAG: SDR family NAD(P)-dependent oxidoreductase, partial [Thermomicrobiales bacterium]
MRLASSVALVTGGGSGIGRAIATRFAQEGAHVAVADLRRERADAVAQEIVEAGGEALPVVADVAAGPAVDALVEQVLRVYDHIDILVNNAAMSRGDDSREIDEATWEFNLNVVLKSAFLCAKAVLPGMIARRRGAIVNI